jgi:hypothetical protein
MGKLPGDYVFSLPETNLTQDMLGFLRDPPHLRETGETL